jgi:signal transduction histidine kinase
MKKIFSSIYGKISMIFLLLLIILGAVQIILLIKFSSEFFTESDQKLNKNLAADLAEKFKPYLEDTLDYKSIAKTFQVMMVMNPRVEFYLLDSNGAILAYFADPEKIKRMEVNIKPIKQFLTAGDDLKMPLYGDDPRSTNRQKPFSVTPIKIGSQQSGFLYVILGGELHDSALSMVEDSYILRTAAVALAVNFVITGIIGLILFSLLTRRLRLITEAVSEFEEGNFKQRVITKSDDEIGQLSKAFNKMAETIDANIEDIKNKDQLRRDLIANISHDLRSPLASVQGYLETIIMKEETLSQEERKNYLEIVHKNIHRLSRLVEDLLELSKLDAKQIKPKPEQFSISELTQDVVLKFKPKAEKQQITIHTNFSSEVSLVEADIGMIERALSNLLENALIYTPEKGEVSVELLEKDEKVSVKVRDNGHGIPENDLPHVFDRFYRGDKSRTSEGTGLGLAITKKIIEAHEEYIDVKSQIGQGTIFQFNLHKPETPAMIKNA